jgi:hypothetical protein
VRDVLKSITSLFKVSTRPCQRCARRRSSDPNCPECAGSGLVFDVRHGPGRQAA